MSYSFNVASGGAYRLGYMLSGNQAVISLVNTPNTPTTNRGVLNRNLIVINGINLRVAGYGQTSNCRLTLWDGNGHYKGSSGTLSLGSNSSSPLPIQSTSVAVPFSYSGGNNLQVGIISSGHIDFTHDTNSSKDVYYQSSISGYGANFTGTDNSTFGASTLDGSVNYIYLPSAPQSPSLYGITASEIDISFSAPSDNGGSSVTNYIVQYSTDPSFSTYSSFNTGTGLAGAAGGLSSNTTYYFRVVAQNGASSVLSDTSAYSNVVSAATLDIPSWVTTGLPSTMTVNQSTGTQISARSAQTITFSVISGSLPPGVTLTSGGGTGTQIGTVSGTPTTAGTYNYTIRAAASGGNASPDQSYTTVVNPGGPKVWSGSNWVSSTLYVWSGSSWVPGTMKVWSGSSWVNLSS